MTNQTTDTSPTPKQLTYIAKLSKSRGVTFGRPRTKTAASQQIAALKAMTAGRTARAIERDQGRRITVQSATAVRSDEVTGYGSSASWSGHVEDE